MKSGRSRPSQICGQIGAGHPSRLGLSGPFSPTYDGQDVRREDVRRLRRDVERLAAGDGDWVTFASRAGEALRKVIPFDRTCWHPVDPGTMLFTGSLVKDMVCDGAWLARYEYATDDVNQWAFLARSGYRAGSLNQATSGNPSRSPRYLSSNGSLGDELRGAFVVDGGYWGAAGFLRDRGRPLFDEDEVRLLASLSPLLGAGFRQRVLRTSLGKDQPPEPPGLVVLDAQGDVESISPAAGNWLEQLVELPPPRRPEESRVLQAVAAQVRRTAAELGGSELPARVRVQTLSGRWLVLDGMSLPGKEEGRIAVMIQPAPAHEVAPLIVQAYGLSEREREITLLCLRGMSTRDISAALSISPYTVQDHFKGIFDKTGARSRAELIGQIFLEHYVPRFQELEHPPAGWHAQEIAAPEALGG